MTDETDAPGQPSSSRGTGKRRRVPAFITKAAHETLSVTRAFGPAYERDGVRVIPVARVTGGTGSGFGGGFPAGPTGPEAASNGNGDTYGGGGGFGAVVKPVGVVTIDDTGVHWKPTIDVNRAILGGQIVLALAVLTTGCVLRRRFAPAHRRLLPSAMGLLTRRMTHRG